MIIYQAEKKAKLEDAIASAVCLYDSHIFKDKDQTAIANLSQANDSESWDERLLYRFNAVLASTGWNLNDDVFVPNELWAARHTPVDKMVNMHHDHNQIVGHMTSTFPALFDGTTIADETDEKEIPSEFDIIVQAVLYKKTRNPETNEAISTLIKEIENGDWCVSMECRFDNFHYMVIGKDNERGIIYRNESTAFLTKHLRAFGGDGEFQGYKLGRVLANYSFSGKGLVKKPANKRSIILNTGHVQASETIASTLIDKEQQLENNMNELEMALAKNKELEQELFSLKNQLAEVVAELAATKEEVSKSVATITERDKTIAQHLDEAKTLNERLSVADTELAAMQAEKKRVERISKLVSAGVTEDEAKVIADKWVSVSDEQFAEIVTLHTSTETVQHPETKDKNAADATDVESVASVDVKPTVPPNPQVNNDSNLSVAQEWVGSFMKKKGTK